MQEDLWIKNDRGLRLSAVLDRPNNDGKQPAVLVLHGFTGFKEEEHIQGFAMALATEGFVALRFDASGFGYSEGNVESDFLTSNYIDDICCALDFLKGLPQVDSTRIGICGHSFGGGLSVIATARNPIIKACCAVQPSRVTWQDYCNRDLEQWQRTGWSAIPCEHPRYSNIRLPWNFVVDRNRYDARLAAAEVHVPLLVMYGTADSIVDPEISIAIYDNAPNPKELIALDGYDHDFKKRPDEVQHVSHLLTSFFRRALLETQ